MDFCSPISVEDNWSLDIGVDTCALEHSIPRQGKYGHNARQMEKGRKRPLLEAGPGPCCQARCPLHIKVTNALRVSVPRPLPIRRREENSRGPLTN